MTTLPRDTRDFDRRRREFATRFRAPTSTNASADDPPSRSRCHAMTDRDCLHPRPAFIDLCGRFWTSDAAGNTARPAEKNSLTNPLTPSLLAFTRAMTAHAATCVLYAVWKFAGQPLSSIVPIRPASSAASAEPSRYVSRTPTFFSISWEMSLS
jgi:hypothetical protein